MSSSDSESSSSSSSQKEERQERPLTAAELMRRKMNPSKSEIIEKKQDGEDIDDEIRRLEAELANDSESDSDSDSDSEESVESQQPQRKKKRIQFGDAVVMNQDEVDEDERRKEEMRNNGGVICISECATEAIVPLPKTALPTSKSKKLKIDRVDNEAEKQSKKRKQGQSDDSGMSDGLRDAVKEVLSGYKPRSSERIPFYCRVCSHQSENEEEFLAHKKSEFHKTAVQVEKKATYCKLCRKQLTSLVQMQEHLDSRPHREKMDEVKARQRGEIRGGRGRGGSNGEGRGRGRGGYGRGRGRGDGRGRGGDRWQPQAAGRTGSFRRNDKRQWC